MIQPTVGRVVWFWPSTTDSELMLSGDQPLAAIIAHVWSDTCVNLAVFSPNGAATFRTSVFLYQGDEGSERPSSQYAEWMPYQKAVAKGDIPPTPHATPPGVK